MTGQTSSASGLVQPVRPPLVQLSWRGRESPFAFRLVRPSAPYSDIVFTYGNWRHGPAPTELRDQEVR